MSTVADVTSPLLGEFRARTYRSGMITPLSRLLALACFLSLLTPGFISFTTQIGVRQPDGSSPMMAALLRVALSIVAAGASALILYHLMRKAGPYLDAAAQSQSDFLGSLDSRYVNLAIFASAALSLFLELSVIRWQSSVFEFFAFYKNFGLLSCFAGLGLGYALANRGRIFLFLSIPLLVWQFVFMFVLRYAWHGSMLAAVRALPFSPSSSRDR